MAKAVLFHVTNELTPQNIDRELTIMHLRRWGVMFAPPDMMHRSIIFFLHAKAPSEKERALWW
jgi:hypothetical protein